jgi:D-tyrosyl-tRNA(Tyr) deacylase
MRALIQRVSRAAITVDRAIIGKIDTGLLAYVGVASGDTGEDVEYLATKIATIRLFPDSEGRFDRSVTDIGGAVLVVSQFTLYAETRRGRRPSFSGAAGPEVAEPLVDALGDRLRKDGVAVQTGRFGALMEVDSLNDGPVSIIIDSADRNHARRP